jgi:hypothetical protein
MKNFFFLFLVGLLRTILIHPVFYLTIKFKVNTYVLTPCKFMHNQVVDLLVRNVSHGIFDTVSPSSGFNNIIFLMSLSYRNFSMNEILKQFRNIRYAQGEMLFGFENSLELKLDLQLELSQVSMQADVFSREMMTHRSKFDFKRFLGPYDVDWQKILHECYVYDRSKAIYYGLNSNNIMEFPSTISFPGNILLANVLKKKNFQFSTDDSQPVSLFVSVTSKKDARTILDPIFDRYPDLKEGMSDIPGVVSYVNVNYEGVLRGLFNAKTYLDTNSKKGQGAATLFEINNLTNKDANFMLNEDSNPLLNSFLNEDHDNFSFILPTEKSGPMALRFNESVFISRALGFTSEGISVSGNSFYSTVPRNKDYDRFVRDEVYSVTGLKSEIMPYTTEQILQYINVDYISNSDLKGPGTSGYTP